MEMDLGRFAILNSWVAKPMMRGNGRSSKDCPPLWLRSDGQIPKPFRLCFRRGRDCKSRPTSHTMQMKAREWYIRANRGSLLVSTNVNYTPFNTQTQSSLGFNTNFGSMQNRVDLASSGLAGFAQATLINNMRNPSQRVLYTIGTDLLAKTIVNKQQWLVVMMAFMPKTREG